MSRARDIAPWAVASSCLAVSACALPPVSESGKNRCVTADDCLGSFDCVDGVCEHEDQNEEISSCPATPCETPLSCYRGLCAETFETNPPCDPYDLDDGCPSDAICFHDPDDTTRCRRFPPCPDSGECPVGPFGGVCVNGELAGKTKMCKPGTCKDAGDCPPAWSCIRYFDSDPFGACSDGSTGMPCRVNQDCGSNNCNDFWRVCV